MESAFLDVRVLPWRPRPRVMKPNTIRENTDPLTAAGEDLSGCLFGLAFWILILIAAPVVVLVLAVGLLSVELPLVIALGLVLATIRFAGILPWTVVIVHQVTGEERRETYRAIWNAVRRIREINHYRTVKVHWAWS
jgi:hypothetical protein